MSIQFASVYEEVLAAVAQYYTTGIDQDLWEIFARHALSPEQAYEVLESLSSVRMGFNGNGEAVFFTYNVSQNINPSTAEAIAQSIDSNINVGTETTNFLVPANASIDPQTETVSIKSGVVNAQGMSVGNFILKEVVPAVAAAGAGISLGVTIDRLLYNANPDFWDSHNMGSLNPDTWSSITTDSDTFAAKAFNTLFKINPEEKTSQMYIEDTALAYIAKYLNDAGAFESSMEVIERGELNISPLGSTFKAISNSVNIYAVSDDGYSELLRNVFDTTKAGKQLVVRYGTTNYVLRANSESTFPASVAPNSYTYNNKTVYYYLESHLAPSPYHELSRLSIGKFAYIGNESESVLTNKDKIAWTMIYGNAEELGVPGIQPQSVSILPTIPDTATIPDVKEILYEQFPEFADKAVYTHILQPDGQLITKAYVPVGVPDVEDVTDIKPTTNEDISSQTNPELNPQTAPDTLLDKIGNIMGNVDEVNLPDTGTGMAPIVILPEGSADALYSIYNPTQAQINALGQWLWSSSFVDQLLKLFSDPMQAIIGLHKIYISPSTGTSQNIKVGYLDSGVASRTVAHQYSTLNCGTVSLREYFGNVFDYSPYTDVKLYLPFIGIVNLDVADVMRSSISVVYHADVLTGACLAEVKVERDGVGGTLYQFSGDCAVHYPLSSGSYLGIISGIASGVTGAVAGFNLGGIAGAALGGVVGGIRGTSSHIAQHGQFTGNAGAMGIKKPYLIISRPQTAMADKFETLLGYPANHYTKLQSCTGFTKVKECHVDDIDIATDEEKEMIERLLKSGVIIQ